MQVNQGSCIMPRHVLHKAELCSKGQRWDSCEAVKSRLRSAARVYSMVSQQPNSIDFCSRDRATSLNLLVTVTRNVCLVQRLNLLIM